MRQAAGGRQVEAGSRRQETCDRKQEAGGRKQEAGDSKRQEVRGGKFKIVGSSPLPHRTPPRLHRRLRSPSPPAQDPPPPFRIVESVLALRAKTLANLLVNTTSSR